MWGIVKCEMCQTEFTARGKIKRFCSGKCRDDWNNKRRLSGIHITPHLFEQLKSLADAHGIAVDEMANVIIHKMVNPDGRPLEPEEIYGQQPRVPT